MAARKLSEITTQPDVRQAFLGWMNTLVALIVSQDVTDDGFVNETTKRVAFRGHLQPFKYEETKYQNRDSQRAWEWWWLYTPDDSPVHLKTNDRIIWKDRNFKVMDLENWGLNGYNLYCCIRDYESI